MVVPATTPAFRRCWSRVPTRPAAAVLTNWERAKQVPARRGNVDLSRAVQEGSTFHPPLSPETPTIGARDRLSPLSGDGSGSRRCGYRNLPDTHDEPAVASRRSGGPFCSRIEGAVAAPLVVLKRVSRPLSRSVASPPRSPSPAGKARSRGAFPNARSKRAKEWGELGCVDSEATDEPRRRLTAADVSSVREPGSRCERAYCWFCCPNCWPC